MAHEARAALNDRRPARKVLLVGWESADWRVIDPLLEAGQMPHFARLLEDGVIGDLGTVDPVLCPLLWTTAVTGVRADKHGILSALETDPVSGSVRLASSTTRSAPALWKLLSQRGLRSLIVGWVASHPAESIDGVVVSDAFAQAQPIHDSVAHGIVSGAVHPEALARQLADLRIDPSDLTGGDLLPFVPGGAAIDQTRDPRLRVLGQLLAESATIHNTATWLIAHEPWDLCAVQYQPLGAWCRAFMPYHSPRTPDVSERDVDLYGGVIAQAFRFHDMMLGRLVELGGEDTTVILISDHGLTAGDHGVFCMKGPGVKKDERIYGVNILDVAPTVLGVFGYSSADMEGHAIASAFVAPLRMTELAHSDSSPTIDEAHFPGATHEQSPQLRRDRQYQLARVHLGADRPATAIPILQSLLNDEPGDTHVMILLAQARYAIGDRTACRELVDSVLATKPEGMAHLLRGMLEAGDGHLDQALECFAIAETFQPSLPRLHLEIGNAYLGLGRWADAERAFEHACDRDRNNVYALRGLARSCLEQDRPLDAAEHARRAVRIRHDNPGAHFDLGVTLARAGAREAAAAAFETCIQLQPDNREARQWLTAIRDRSPDAGGGAS